MSEEVNRYKRALSTHINAPHHYFVVLRFMQPKRNENTDLVKTWREKKPKTGSEGT